MKLIITEGRSEGPKKGVALVSEKLGGVMGASGPGLTLRPFGSLAPANFAPSDTIYAVEY